MATATYVQRGDSIDYTPGADVAAGAVVVQGNLVAIAKLDIKSGKLGALATTGVYRVPKEAGSSKAIAAGKTVYWDATNQRATETSSGNTLMGKTVLATVDADTSVLVRLSQ